MWVLWENSNQVRSFTDIYTDLGRMVFPLREKQRFVVRVSLRWQEPEVNGVNNAMGGMSFSPFQELYAKSSSTVKTGTSGLLCFTVHTVFISSNSAYSM